MPSPLAHASLVFLARPLLAQQGLAHLPRARRWSFYTLVAFALCVPDVDFALRLLPPHPMHDHGTYTHSITAAILFAPLFGIVAHRILAGAMPFWSLALVGFVAYGSHLLMDMFTPGRGIMLLWPLTDQRFASPVPLFYGAEHSDLWAWRTHLITLTTELAFAALVLFIAMRLMPARREDTADRPTIHRLNQPRSHP